MSWNSVGCSLPVDVGQGGQIIRLTEKVSWDSVGCCLPVDVGQGGQIIRLTQEMSWDSVGCCCLEEARDIGSPAEQIAAL